MDTKPVDRFCDATEKNGLEEVVELRRRGALKDLVAPQIVWFERVQGACKMPHKITNQSMIETYHSKHQC